MLPDLEPKAIEVAAQKSGVQQSVVSFVAKANEMQIRKLRAKGHDCIGEIQIEISRIAMEYGARNGLDQLILDECTRLLLEKYSMLAVSEIRAAYRAWASGEIEVTSAEMYGGTMDVRQFGKILTAWVDYRNKVFWHYTNEAERVKREKIEEEKRVKLERHFNENFDSILDGYKSKAKTWDDVPVFLFDTLVEKGILKFEDGEALMILEEAKEIASEEAKKIKLENIGNPIKSGYVALVEASIGERSKVIARKLSIFRKVFNK